MNRPYFDLLPDTNYRENMFIQIIQYINQYSLLDGCVYLAYMYISIVCVCVCLYVCVWVQCPCALIIYINVLFQESTVINKIKIS